MRRYLLVALWPAGMAAIAAATVIAARRAPRAPVSPARSPAGAGQAGLDGARLADVADAAEHGAAEHGAAEHGAAKHGAAKHGAAKHGAAEHGAGTNSAEANGTGTFAPGPLTGVSGRIPGVFRRLSDPAGQPAWLPDLIKLGAVSCAGGVLSYGVMALLGPTVVNHGPAIDEPIFRWTTGHQVKKWAAIMERLGKVGNPWTTWGAAATAAVCLGVTWPKQKWLPAATLGTAIVVDHYATLALRHKFNRLGPPTSPLGTYPSGGCDRVVLFYGTIAYLLWREFSGSYRGKVWSIGTVAALSFNEAYSREYLSKHWFTDIVTGLLYGGVLLGPFIAAVRLVAGPANVNSAQGRPALAATAGDRASGRAGLPSWVTTGDQA